MYKWITIDYAILNGSIETLCGEFQFQEIRYRSIKIILMTFPYKLREC